MASGPVNDLTTREDFKIAFKNTFMGKTSKAEQGKQMQERFQMKGESITACFLEKALLCNALGLVMQHTKEQVLVGLRFKEACISMLLNDHKDKDELLADLQRLERLTKARMQHYPGAKPHGGDPGTVIPYAKTSWSAMRPTEQALTNARVTDQASGGGPPKKRPEHPKRGQSVRKCYSCGRYGHIVKDYSRTHLARIFMANEYSRSDSGPLKCLKTAMISGTYQLPEMIDPRSSDCILRQQVTERSNLQVVCKVQALYGLGNNDWNKSIGTSEIDIEIDGVLYLKDKVVVVHNSALFVGMLVGRTWTEQDHNAMHTYA